MRDDACYERAPDFLGYAEPVKMWRSYGGWRWFDVARELIHEALVQPVPLRQRSLSSAGIIATRRAFTVSQLRLVLPRLITTCSVCDSKALYRAGLHGLCRAHKHLTPPEVERWRRDYVTGQLYRSLDIHKSVTDKRHRLRHRAFDRYSARPKP